MRKNAWVALATVLVISLLAACGTPGTPTATVQGTVTAKAEPPTVTAAAGETPQAAGTPTQAAAATAAATPKPAKFEKGSCPFTMPSGQTEGTTVQCGYLSVPEDRSDPKSRTIQLAVAIFKNPNGNTQPDPIFYLEGGPGGSPLEFIDLSFSDQFEPVFAANRDLVIFDQRGVGFSKPALDCPNVDSLDIELLAWKINGKTVDLQQAIAASDDAMLTCAKNLSKEATLSDYNTATDAADVNDLRLALGYDKVNLWGISYGTRLALEVMRSYPEGVRSVVIDSVVPPDVDTYASAPANAERAFDTLFNGCTADSACNTAYPNLKTVFFDTVTKLNANPASFQAPNPFTGENYDVVLKGDDLINVIFQLFYDTSLIPSIPDLMNQASQGDMFTISRLVGVIVAQQKAISPGMNESVTCHDMAPLSNAQKVQAALAQYPQLANAFENSNLGPTAFQLCTGWGAGVAPAADEQPVTSDLPTLLTAGQYDPITPPAWTEHAAATLKSGHEFQYPGSGHGPTGSPGCAQDMMIAFVKDPTVVPDSSCIGQMKPPQFVVPVSSETVQMVPFTNTQTGVQGVVPQGWTEVGTGDYARQSSLLDSAELVEGATSGTDQTVLTLLSTNFGLSETPSPTGTRQANGLTWTLYTTTVQGAPTEIALAQSGGQVLLVILRCDPGERDALYQAVFLPAVDALKPLS